MKSLLRSLVFASALAACSAPVSTVVVGEVDAGVDAGVSVDAGPDEAVDAGPDDVDAGEAAQPDAGTDPVDAGSGPDAGSSADPHDGSPCSAYGVTESGDCLGTVSRWCDVDTDTIAVLDCGGPEIGGTCAFEGSSTVNCAVPESAPCSVVVDGTFSLFACGTGGIVDTSLACDLSTGCRPTTATCIPANPVDCTTTGQCTANERCYIEAGETLGYCVYRPQCHGDDLIIDCTEGKQAQVWNCLEQGGSSCVDGSCIGMPAGSYCDTEFLCETGLSCVAGACQ